MSKWISIFLLCLLPVTLFSEDNTKKKKEGLRNFTILSQYSNDFSIKGVYFNKVLHIGGKGELLEVEFNLINNNDDPMNFYIFVIATYEKDMRNAKSSFSMPLKEKEIRKRIRNFVPYPKSEITKEDPHGMANFTYLKKDNDGKEIKFLKKFPKDPKKGVDLKGKMYKLKKKLFVVTTHLCKYRKNYNFFNEIAIIIYNEKGEGVYRQLYNIKGIRR